MSETKIKFDESELTELKSLQQSYQEIQSRFGQLRVQQLLLKQQLEEVDQAELKLEDEYKSTQQKERDLVSKLNDKYGPGTLNPETGEFTPAESVESTSPSN